MLLLNKIRTADKAVPALLRLLVDFGDESLMCQLSVTDLVSIRAVTLHGPPQLPPRSVPPGQPSVMPLLDPDRRSSRERGFNS
jgi:hypothetical protein